MKEVKNITSTWFEVKVSGDRTDESGATRKVKELYCVNAFSFTEAEARTMAHIGDYGGEVVEEKIASYKYVLSIPDMDNEKWYKCKVVLTTINENTGKPKRSSVYYLVNSDSTAGAESIIKDFYNSSIECYEIASIVETSVLEIITK
jgi:hypothetical protein